MDTLSIPLTQDKCAIIDAVDGEIVVPYRWHAFRVHRTWYAATSVNGRHLYMHRLILGNPSERVDHRDGDGLNNRRANLRTCSHAQNMANARLPERNQSGFRGVNWFPRDGVWVARIKFERRNRYLGRFDDPIEAALVYDDAARRLFGEFARLNFPHDGEQGVQ